MIAHSRLGDGGARVIDAKLPESSVVHRTHFHERHVLIRPYLPEGFRIVPGMDESLPFERRSIFVSGRDPKHPRVWAWILAVREHDLAIDPSLAPGNMIVFKRYGDEKLDEEPAVSALWDDEKKQIRLLHIDSIECTFSPPLIEQRY